jgi:hypothetical protein
MGSFGSRLLLWSAVSCAALALGGCRGKATPPNKAAASASVAAAEPPAPQAPARCRSVGTDPALVIGKPEPRAEGAEGDDDIVLPFASTVGEASAFEGGFAIGAVRTERGTSEAVLALVGHDAKPGRIVSLGRVFGDPEPPLVAARKDITVVAVPDGDANGTMLKLASLATGEAEPKRGSEISNVDPEAGFSLALGERNALVVFGIRGRAGVSLKALRFDPKDPGRVAEGHEVAGSGGAEAVILTARSGGFFLVFAAEEPTVVPDALKPKEDAGVDGGTDPDLVVAAPRVLRVVALDADGRVVGGVRTLSAPGENVGGFDAAPLSDGALLIAYRREEPGTGLDQSDVSLTRVTLDGSTTSGRVEEAEPGFGVPRILVDVREKRSWLLARGAGDSALLGIFAPDGLSVDALLPDAGLRGAELFAVERGRFLTGRARGRAMELALVECQVAAPRVVESPSP